MQNPNLGILGSKAPQWQVLTWFNLPDTQQRLDLVDLSGSVVYLYCFQSWCPGCHSSGFPSLLATIGRFKTASDVAFVTVQTVFEGFGENTAERARETASKFGLTIPLGHDSGPENTGSPLMRNYRSGGTPWTVLIGKDGHVYFNDFHAEPNSVGNLIDTLRTRT